MRRESDPLLPAVFPTDRRHLPMPKADWIYLENVDVVSTTETAVLVQFKDGKSYWVPKSKILPDDLRGLKKVKGITLAVNNWFASRVNAASED